MAEKVSFLDKILATIDPPQAEAVRTYTNGLCRNKRRLEEILDRIEEGLILIDQKGIVQWANRRAFFYLGFPSYSGGRTRLVDLVDEPPLKEFFSSSLRQSAVSMTEEFCVLQPREMSLRLHWIPLESNGENEVLIKIENTTQERWKKEEQARAERTEGLIRLASGIAHEIGNPLNSIQIHLALLNREINALPKAQRKSFNEMIGVISSETRRLDEIIRSFLKSTRRPPLRFKKDSVNDILEEVLKILAPEIKKSKVKTKVSFDKKIPLFLLDRGRLHEAFLNLIKNAVEAMPDGGELRLNTGFRENVCYIAFQDGGTGILAKDLPHIFEAYYTTKHEGSGLGLTQVDQGVREHGGRIDIKTEPGRGSIFTLILPIRREKLSLPEPPQR